MKAKLKYNYNGQLLTKLDILNDAFERAKHFPAEEREQYIKTVSRIFSDESMKDNFQTIYLPSAGALFLILILGATYLTPFPTAIQSGALWVILSIAAAACASVIPGFIEFKFRGLLRAGGALAVFCLMYLHSPDIINKTNGLKVAKISLYVVEEDSASVQILNPEFDPNSHEVLTVNVTKIINNYFGTKFPASHYTFFRKDDGMIYQDESCSEIRDYKLLVIPNTVVSHFIDKRKAYIKFNSMSVNQ